MSAPIPRERILQLVPHQGAMCLWDEVLAFDDARISLRTHSHRDAAHPLRSGGRLRAVHLCEYGAQAMAVHGGLVATPGAPVRAGMLVALRAATLHCTRIDDLPGALDCEAELLVSGDSGAQYTFRITHRGELLAEGRAGVMYAGG